jgi:hypothetical protein
MKYEKIEMVYKRKSTRKNSKWFLEFTTSKMIDEEQYNRIMESFQQVPEYYEKYEEEYKSLKGIKGIKYYTIYNLTKRETVLIPVGD